MAGDIKEKYAASSTATVTNLHSLPSSQDWTAGWSSATFTNTVNNYQDYLASATFTTHASNRQAGSINIYLIASLNDTPTWPAAATGAWGTEGVASFVDAEERDAACVLFDSITVDNSASAVMPRPQRAISSFFGGRIPTHFCFFVAQNCTTTTTAGLASSGSALYTTPVYSQYT